MNDNEGCSRRAGQAPPMYDETAKGWSSAGQAPPIYNETAKDCSSAGQAPPTYNAAANGCSSAGAVYIYVRSGTVKTAGLRRTSPTVARTGRTAMWAEDLGRDAKLLSSSMMIGVARV